MRIIDKDGRLFGIINVVDLYVIIVLFLLISFGIYKVLVVNPNLAASTKKATIKFFLPEVSYEIAKAVIEGDIIKDYDKGFLYGKVVEKEIVPSSNRIKSADKSKYDVLIYIETEAVVSDTAVCIGNQEVKIGWTSIIKARTFTAEGSIKDIILH